MTKKKIILYLVGVNWIMLLVLLVSFLCVKSLKDIPIYDLAGAKTRSIRFLMLERKVNMERVDSSWIDYEFLNAEFPNADTFHRSSKIPMTIVVNDGIIKLIRVGRGHSNLGNTNHYELTPLLK